jgi:hypothetical protein
MGKPFLNAENPIQGAMCEVISAMSSLNMAPEPMKHDPKCFYLSQTDARASHAMEHMQAVCELLRRAEHEREMFRVQVCRLEIRLKGVV